jgi:hypothetical protein
MTMQFRHPFLPAAALALLALAACSTQSGQPVPIGGTAPNDLATTARTKNYLYVASHAPGATQHFIQVFRLVNGLPRTTPDRTYTGYGPLLAIAGNGTLYTQAFGSDDVVAFDGGSLTPTRDISFPNLSRCRGPSRGVTISSLAADRTGNLFVASYAYGELHPKGKLPCEAVFVYSATADGNAAPLQTIKLPEPDPLSSMAVDANDNLYVLLNPAKVKEFANAVAGPTPARTFLQSGSLRFLSLAVDDAGNLFLGKNDYSYKNARIERYTPTAHPNGHPTSTIVLNSDVNQLYSMAVAVRRLFVDNDFQNVDVYRARKRGPQGAIYTLPVTNIDALATTP